MSEEKDFFEIDLYNLDQEWQNQPKLYHTYAMILVEARKALEQAKADQELKFAKLELDVRKNPTKYGLAKVTEGSIEKTVTIQDEYQDVVRTVIKAKYRVDKAQVDVTTLDHRKKALEKEVDLFLADYFAQPKAKSLASKEHIEELGKDKFYQKTKLRRTSDE